MRGAGASSAYGTKAQHGQCAATRWAFPPGNPNLLGMPSPLALCTGLRVVRAAGRGAGPGCAPRHSTCLPGRPRGLYPGPGCPCNVDVFCLCFLASGDGESLVRFVSSSESPLCPESLPAFPFLLLPPPLDPGSVSVLSVHCTVGQVWSTCPRTPACQAARSAGTVRVGGRGARLMETSRVDVFPSQDEDSEFTLASDFEIGHFFRERIVPRAVLYFTGEAIEDDDNVCGQGCPEGQLGVPRWRGTGQGWSGTLGGLRAECQPVLGGPQVLAVSCLLPLSFG